MTTIKTYHCLCSNLLLSTTHTLSTLPLRSPPSLDSAIILPLPSSPPSNPTSTTSPLPKEGFTTLLGLIKDRKPLIIRKEDGFEKRVLWRCGRCGVGVGYEVLGLGSGAGQSVVAEKLGEDGGEGEIEGIERGEEVYKGRILYVLPGGMVETSLMMSGRKIGEGDVDIVREGGGGVAVFE